MGLTRDRPGSTRKKAAGTVQCHPLCLTTGFHFHIAGRKRSRVMLDMRLAIVSKDIKYQLSYTTQIALFSCSNC